MQRGGRSGDDSHGTRAKSRAVAARAVVHVTAAPTGVALVFVHVRVCVCPCVCVCVCVCVLCVHRSFSLKVKNEAERFLPHVCTWLSTTQLAPRSKNNKETKTSKNKQLNALTYAQLLLPAKGHHNMPLLKRLAAPPALSLEAARDSAGATCWTADLSAHRPCAAPAPGGLCQCTAARTSKHTERMCVCVCVRACVCVCVCACVW